MKEITGLIFVMVFLFAGNVSIHAGDRLMISTIGEPPLSAPDHDGYQDLIVIELFNRLGYDIDIYTPPGRRALTHLNSGIHDGTYTRIKGLQKKFLNILLVPEKIVDVDFVALTTRPDIEIKGWEDLADYKIAFLRGWVIFETNITTAKYIEIVDHSSQLFNMLAQNRVDIILYEKWQGLKIVKELKIEGVQVLLPPLATMEMFMYVHKRHKDIVNKLVATIRTMKADGTFKKVYNQKLAPLLIK